MKRSSIIWIIVIVVVVIAGIWYWSSSMGSQSPSNTNTGATTQSAPMIPATTSTTTMAVVLNTESTSTLGTYLVATNGMTLYKYTPDTPGASNCTGACATAWPPYTISADEASAMLGGTPGITGTVGTITRADGSLQVTYNDVPLYFYAKDQNVGDTNGQNVGGVWFVVAP
jgi:predicted lipoprotein with Yx(FWY)xxD motif